jgi:hypothetical protein
MTDALTAARMYNGQFLSDIGCCWDAPCVACLALAALLTRREQEAVEADRNNNPLLLEISRVTESDGTVWNGDTAAIALVTRLEKELKEALHIIEQEF